MFLPFLDTFETGETRKIVKKWDKTEHRRRKSRCEEFTHYNCTLLTIYLGPAEDEYFYLAQLSMACCIHQDGEGSL